MKALLIGSLLISTSTFAQSIDVNGFKKLLTERQVTLEKAVQGMSKRLVTQSVIDTDNGNCSYTQTVVQTILAKEGSKIIIHSVDNFVPAASEACTLSNYEAYTDTTLFYEDAPSLSVELADLDATAPSVKSIQRSGDLVTMNLGLVSTNEDGTSSTEAVTVKYDVSKSAFSNLISQSWTNFNMTSVELPLVDVNTINLSKVFFCDNTNGELTDCVEGDYSDILF